MKVFITKKNQSEEFSSSEINGGRKGYNSS